MGAVTTLIATVAVTAGAVAAFRYVDKKRRDIQDILNTHRRDGHNTKSTVIDYERDPESGVFKPKQ